MHKLRAVVGFSALAILVAAPGWAAELPEGPLPPETKEIAPEFYTGGMTRSVELEGDLVCLSESLVVASAPTECPDKDHVYALVSGEGQKVQPILAASEEVFEQIRKLVVADQMVVVLGHYYPRTGLVLATSIKPVPGETLGRR